MNEQIFITKSFGQTQKLGERIAKELKPGNLLCLYGELGSGKTTFVQGLAKGLGIKRRIISPTFIIVRTYKLENKELEINDFYHVDLYRIDSEKDIEGLGLKEIIENGENIVVIEWAEKLKNLLPKNRIDIFFESLEEDKRRITIKNYE